MMREIKFRGKRTGNGEWATGDLLTHGTIFSTIHNDGVYARLDDETIGQYTGIKDIKGNEIYEGDIVQALYNTDCQSRFKGKVIFNDGAFLLEDDKGMVELLYNLKEYCTLEVVGNAYEEGNGGQNND